MIEHLKGLGVFAKTVELGSFRSAARALSLSPSVVSHHVSELERALSLSLLYRSTRRLALTPDGERLYQAAREMLAAAERGLDAVSGGGDKPTGLLRITAPAMLAETGFCHELAVFSRANPGIKFAFTFTEQPHDLLRDGLDLALRIGQLADSTHKVRRLAQMRRVLVASPRYLATRPEPRTLRDLEGWDLLQLSTRRPLLALVPPGRKTPRTLAFTPRIAIDSATAMRELTLAGLGAATLPELLVRKELERGRLVRVLPAWSLPVLGVFALWPDHTQRPGLTLRFVDFIAPRLEALFREPS